VRRSVLTLVLLSCFTFFLGLGRPAISDSDEGFYAEAAREMVESGDWLTPHFNYEDRWQKPILYYWLTAATYLAFGESEWAARWWSAFSGLGLVLLTWAAARRLTGRDDAAWLAGAMTATCYGYFAMARLALPDLPLTFFITLAIWSALEQRWILAGVAAGLGLLMKGPIALAIPGIVLVPIWWREAAFANVAARRGFLQSVFTRDLVVAAAVCAAVALPWYVAMTLEHGTAYLQSFLVGDNLERFATDRFNQPRALWFYLPIVVGGMMPWSVYLLVPFQSAMRVTRRQRRLTDVEWRLLLWAAVPLLFFTISIGKQPRYILPVLPPLAILLARSISTRIADTNRGPALAAATWGTAALYAALAILLYRARPLFINTYPWLTLLGVGIIAACAGVLAWVALSKQWARLPLTATICAGLLLFSIQFGALAGARPEPVEQMAALVRANRGSDEPIGTYQTFVRNLVFYTRFKQVDLYDEGVALNFLKSPGRVLLVVRELDLPRLQAISGVAVRPIARLQYFNAAGVRLRTVLSPIPGQDFETILLVTNR
jgi:4-amino-4-deoxy-L-arabinose transferase-like glycosyltransferase